jgi:hypothetical protein
MDHIVTVTINKESSTPHIQVLQCNRKYELDLGKVAASTILQIFSGFYTPLIEEQKVLLIFNFIIGQNLLLLEVAIGRQYLHWSKNIHLPHQNY